MHTQALQLEGDIDHQGADALRGGEVCIEGLLEVDRRQPEIVLQHEVVEVEDLAEFGRETGGLEEVGDAQCTPRNFVLIGRTDPATGGADGIRAAGLLAGAVECDM